MHRLSATNHSGFQNVKVKMSTDISHDILIDIKNAKILLYTTVVEI